MLRPALPQCIIALSWYAAALPWYATVEYMLCVTCNGREEKTAEQWQSHSMLAVATDCTTRGLQRVNFIFKKIQFGFGQGWHSHFVSERSKKPMLTITQVGQKMMIR